MSTNAGVELLDVDLEVINIGFLASFDEHHASRVGSPLRPHRVDCRDGAKDRIPVWWWHAPIFF
jgi:hypothetical protein